MKSFFTKLGKMLLCGVAVAVVGCTDYDTDIQNVNERVDAVEADLEQALADLGSKVQANAAAISALEATLNSKIAEEVKNLNAAIDKKADKATVDQQFEALNATLADAKTALETAIKTNADAIEGAVARITALETAGKALQEAVAKNAGDIAALQTDLKAQVEALYAYIDTAVEEIYTAIEVVQEFASAINTLLQEEVARLDIEDAAIWEKIETIEEVCTNLANLIALEAEERKAADDLIYQEIATLTASISSVYTTLDEKIDTEVAELNNKINTEVAELNKTIAELTQTVATVYTYVTELEAALNAHVAAFNAYKETNDARVAEAEAAIEALQDEIDLVNKAIETVNQTISAVLASHADDIAALRTELQAAVEGLNANIETTQEVLTSVINIINGLSADVEALLGRIQSLVYVPEYSDGKADILYGTINTTAGSSASAISDLMIVSHASTLKYKVNADNAAEVASAIAAAKNALSYEVKTVKTRAQEELVPALEIVNVTAENGYILVDVYAKNFAKEFFLGKKNMYSAALKLSDGNNNATTEFTNLTAVKVNELTPVVEPTKELHEIPYDKVDTTVVILKGNKVVFYNENGVALTDAQVAKYDLAIERSLKAVQGNKTRIYDTNVEGSVYAESNDEGVRRIYDVTFNTEINDFVVRMGDKFTRKDNGRVFPFFVVYTINGYEISASSDIELTPKQVSFNVPAIVVDWTVALADELRVNGELYAKDLVRRTPEYVVPENFEGYTLKQIFNTNNEGDRRYVSFNGVEVKQSVTNITATMDEPNTSLAKLKGTYVFPEYNAENEYNVYVLTLVKKLEDLHATITFTFKLGKKAAPVVIDMPATKLRMIGEYPYYFGEADFAGEAYKKFLEFAGYAKEADAKAAFEAAFAEAAAVADEKPNYVTVNGEAGSYNNIDYLNGYVRFYNINKLAEGTQNFVSAINKFWFGVPFTFKTPATLDVPTNLLVYSMGDYVVDVENVKTVYVDAKIVDGVYTVNKSDLAKYFAVSKDADNYNNLDVTFEVKTIDAPKPATSTVEVSVDPNPEVANLVLAKDKAVITDWTNNGQFKANRIEVEAILTVNDAFELDRKPVVLVVKDPLQFAAATPVKEPRYTGEPAVAYPFQGISVKSILEGELVDSAAESIVNLFKSDVNKTYGLTLTHKLARVYYVVGEEKVAYESSKYHYDETTGVVTLYADDAILNTSIFAEIEYSIAHRLNEKSADDCTKTVTVEFYPSKK